MLQHERFMAAALRLGRRNQGVTAPNPSVACLLVRGEGENAVIVGQGITAQGGRPHAEIVALEEAGAEARGATAYVTLEPCAHQGISGPCSTALIDAGIARVVYALPDPNPLTAGKSIAAFSETGIEVIDNVCREEAVHDHAGHILRMAEKRPFVQLKLAQTKNNVIGWCGKRLMVTGEEAQALSHRLRAQCDALLVGSGTVLADDPLLTCRLPGMEKRTPARFIFDRRLRIPLQSQLVRSAQDVPLTVFTSRGAPAEKIAALQQAGAFIESIDDETFVLSSLRRMSEMGITRLLLEGGVKIARSFLADNIVDEVFLFTSPDNYENEDAVFGLTPGDLLNPAYNFLMVDEWTLGRDSLKIYRRNSCSPD